MKILFIILSITLIFTIFNYKKIKFYLKYGRFIKRTYIERIGDFYVDLNGNKWKAGKYSFIDAKVQSAKLKNCYNCTDCENCVDCINCENCADCRKCHNIIDRKNVIGACDYEMKYFGEFLEFLIANDNLFYFFDIKTFLDNYKNDYLKNRKKSEDYYYFIDEYEHKEDCYYGILHEFKKIFNFELSDNEIKYEIELAQKRAMIEKKLILNLEKFILEPYYEYKIMLILKEVILNSEKRYLKFLDILETQDNPLLYIYNMYNIKNPEKIYLVYDEEKYILESIRV